MQTLQNRLDTLQQHHFEGLIQDGRLMALETSVFLGHTQQEWVDVTEANLKQWLGY